MVKKGSVPFHFDKTRPTRFGVLPRYASDASAIRWFEAPGEGFMIFHVSNAWQEGSLVKLYVCAFKEVGAGLRSCRRQGRAAGASPRCAPHHTRFAPSCLVLTTDNLPTPTRLTTPPHAMPSQRAVQPGLIHCGVRR